ncbi:S9 family peptidase [Sphingomonas radiodurans]|uniref:S9 family peptidase n=1 Tax=Sphingomonas radiodurans TaxID=2890321 RepID=UPI001E3E45F3|nr:S9 family peptidase [Sphingomonas radiodurans]WBH15986.1 S9 family peptidase [Sphingomonas radiodurans]
MRVWMASIGVGLSLLANSAVAEPKAAAAPLTLERVFASPDLAGDQPQALRLSPDGTLLTSVRPREDERARFDLWAMDTRTGISQMLVDSRKVGSGEELSEAEKMQRERDRSKTGKTGILDYDWAPDGKSILVPIDGELFVAALDGTVRKLAGTKGALNPVVSPRGGHVSLVRDQNLWVGPATGEARAITSDGGGTVHVGEAEFVAQEEMARRTGYWWSPDDKRIAVERFDEAPVRIFTRASIGASGTSIYQQRYPAAGTPNVLVDLFIMAPDGSGKVQVDLGPNRDIYLARVDWLPDGSALLVQRQSRDQRTLDMLLVDPATGKATVMFTEQAGAKSWVNLTDAYRVLADGSLIWRSERDGFGHLYRWNAGSWTQLTKGDWSVESLVAIDEKAGRLFFTGNRDGVLERHLYALDLARPDAITQLTEPGWWLAGASADGQGTRFIISRSNPRQPKQIYLADATGKRIAWVNENAVASDHPYAPFLPAHRPTQFGTIKAADGTPLHWQMITPVLEKGKRYPVFFMHYGGPHSQEVARDWPGNMPLRQFLVQQGWIVFQIDNRGSANRGKVFEDAIWHAMGSVEVDDQLAGAAYLKTLPFVDPNAIATYGWSYGGYMTLKMIEAHPGVFAAGISGAPVTDWALYDTHYTERYMGDPTRDAAAYTASSALPDAPMISDPLLIMHGMADDNVFLDNTTAFAARMQAANKPFEMMLYPGKAHGAVRDIHAWTTMLDFLDHHVKKPARK